VLIIGAGIVLLIGFLAGFVAQFRNASALRNDLHNRDERVRTLEREAATSRAQDVASLIYQELTRRNYGIAAQHPTESFDQVRTRLGDSPPEVRGVLKKLLRRSDAVTAGLGQGDPRSLA
jgi:hypothetical protein